jgi:hypothetical protein
MPARTIIEEVKMKRNLHSNYAWRMPAFQLDLSPSPANRGRFLQHFEAGSCYRRLQHYMNTGFRYTSAQLEGAGVL